MLVKFFQNFLDKEGQSSNKFVMPITCYKCIFKPLDKLGHDCDKFVTPLTCDMQVFNFRPRRSWSWQIFQACDLWQM